MKSLVCKKMVSVAFLMVLTFSGVLANESGAPRIDNVEERLNRLEISQMNSTSNRDGLEERVDSRLDKIEEKIEDAGLILFISGVLCAFWAQYSRRSAWLWFFFGLLLAPVALILVLFKTSDDLNRGRMRYWDGGLKG